MAAADAWMELECEYKDQMKKEKSLLIIFDSLGSYQLIEFRILILGRSFRNTCAIYLSYGKYEIIIWNDLHISIDTDNVTKKPLLICSR